MLGKPAVKPGWPVLCSIAVLPSQERALYSDFLPLWIMRVQPHQHASKQE